MGLLLENVQTGKMWMWGHEVFCVPRSNVCISIMSCSGLSQCQDICRIFMGWGCQGGVNYQILMSILEGLVICGQLFGELGAFGLNFFGRVCRVNLVNSTSILASF